MIRKETKPPPLESKKGTKGLVRTRSLLEKSELALFIATGAAQMSWTRREVSILKRN